MAHYDDCRPEELSATRKSIEFARRLLLSSSLPADEADHHSRWLASTAFKSQQAVSAIIDWARERLDEAAHNAAASRDRKAAYYAEREGGER